MNLKELIKLISEREEIINQPPVLLDLGASGSLNPVWEPISKFCIGVAFDADNRDFNFIESKTSSFKKMFVYNSIVTAKENEEKIKFYLTESPYCSSTLRPLNEKLKPFHYSSMFEIKQVVDLNAKNIGKAFQEMGIQQVDWFKTDTQGTDLRLFKSLPLSLQSNCTVVQFEPGIVDAYEGEDKLHDVMAYMQTLPMMMYECNVLGAINIPNATFLKLFPSKAKIKLASNVLKSTPGWAEISYVRKLDDIPNATKRDFIVSWLFMMMEKQYATAHYMATLAAEKFPDDELMKNMFAYSDSQMKTEIFHIRNWKVFLSVIKSKLFS